MSEENKNDMLLFEDDLNDDENEELKRDIPEDDEELEEMFNGLINEEEIDDEESDDLDEIEDAEEEDGVEIIDSDHPDYDQPIILDKDETITTDVANSDNEIEEDYLFEDEKEDEDKKQPGYSELRAKFLDSQMIVPTTFGPHNSVSVNTSNSGVSASSVSDGGMSAANGSATVSGAVTESVRGGAYLYEKDLPPEYTYVDLRNGILATDAKVGYTIGTPEVDDVNKDGKIDIIANENYVDDKNKAFPFIAIGEDSDFAVVKSFKNHAEKIHETLLNTFKLENENKKQIFVTNESIENVRRILSETGKIENGKAICENCGSNLTMNESNELVCENCNEEIEESLKNSKEVGEVICNECGVQETVDPNVNEDELVCENCGSTDVEFKTKVINEDEVNESYTIKDLIRYTNALSESLGKRVDIVISKESYMEEVPKVYNPSSLLVNKVDFGEGFKKVIVVEPKVNNILKEFYTDNEITLENLEKEFNMNAIQRVNNESQSGLLENYLNPLDEVNEDVKEKLSKEINLELLEENINFQLKNKDDSLYEGIEESLEEYYEDIVFEAYENVPNEDETRLKKFLEENINDLNVSKVIQVNESSISINGHDSVSFDEYTEKELMEKLSEESRLERDLLNENIFKIINI
ncbi:hypothetical protein [Staphylococcus phage LY01]|nr:hypothetical protein [Staphylococcus phage LY01]